MERENISFSNRATFTKLEDKGGGETEPDHSVIRIKKATLDRISGSVSTNDGASVDLGEQT